MFVSAFSSRTFYFLFFARKIVRLVTSSRKSNHNLSLRYNCVIGIRRISTYEQTTDALLFLSYLISFFLHFNTTKKCLWCMFLLQSEKNSINSYRSWFARARTQKKTSQFHIIKLEKIFLHLLTWFVPSLYKNNTRTIEARYLFKVYKKKLSSPTSIKFLLFYEFIIHLIN